MRLILVLLTAFITKLIPGQIVVSNPNPDISVEFKKVLFIGIDNPVVISTGNLKSVKVQIKNGTIKKTNEPGKYFIKPIGISGAITSVIFTAPNFKKKVEFEVNLLPDPEIDVVANRNEDGMIIYFQHSTGVFVHPRPLDLDIKYTIDSFTIIFTDSTGDKIHRNIGATWDATTSKMLKEAKPETKVLITHFDLTSLGRRIRVFKHLEYYIRQR
jgi:GldM C-terminal domain